MIALDLNVGEKFFSPVRPEWNDTTRLAITEGRWP